MRIVWDCRSVAESMGGIGNATLGWLETFIACRPSHWDIHAIISAHCNIDFLRDQAPSLINKAKLHFVPAGMIDPEFEQVVLPTILKSLNATIYLNTCFCIPAVKTTRFQCAVVHDTVFFDRPDWVQPDLRRFLENGTDLTMKCADHVFTVSDFSRKRIKALTQTRRWTPSMPIDLIFPRIQKPTTSEHSYTGANPNLIKLLTQEKFFLYLGSMEQKKGLKVLLDAYAKLTNNEKAEIPKLVLAGGRGGQEFDLAAEVGSRNLLRSTVILGRVNSATKSFLLAHCLAFIFPSLYEGFGMPPLEAMAHNAPVIASDATALPEILGSAAVIVKAGSASDLADAMLQLAECETLRKCLSEKGKKHSKRFESNLCCESLIKTFSSWESNR